MPMFSAINTTLTTVVVIPNASRDRAENMSLIPLRHQEARLTQPPRLGCPPDGLPRSTRQLTAGLWHVSLSGATMQLFVKA